MAWVAVAVTGIKAASDIVTSGQEAAANDRARNDVNAGKAQALGYLQPYLGVGQNSIDQYTKLVTDPAAQFKYIQDNPLYAGLAKQAKDTLFNNVAAKGKFNSGGTAEALQNALLLTGTNLLQRDLTNRRDLITMGQNAANNSANIATGAATQNANLSIDRGNIDAAGTSALGKDISSGIGDIYGVYQDNQKKKQQQRVQI